MNSLINWAASSEFVSSSIPSWQILTAHAQRFRRARDLVFCLTVPLDSLLVWASSEGSGETARMRRLAWTFAARIGDKYQIRLARPNLFLALDSVSKGIRNGELIVFFFFFFFFLLFVCLFFSFLWDRNQLPEQKMLSGGCIVDARWTVTLTLPRGYRKTKFWGTNSTHFKQSKMCSQSQKEVECCATSVFICLYGLLRLSQSY